MKSHNNEIKDQNYEISLNYEIKKSPNYEIKSHNNDIKLYNCGI